MKILLADDEPLARDVLKAYLADYPEVNLIGEAENGIETVEKIQALRPELVFLDIQMPDLNGFGVLRQLKGDWLPAIVFVTAFDQYALQAFEAQAWDYLLKPFDKARFKKTFERVKTYLKLEKNLHPEKLMQLAELYEKYTSLPLPVQNQEEYLQRFLVKEPRRYFFIKVGEVEWIEAAGDYVSLHLQSKNYLIQQTMNFLEQKLNPAVFARIHRSTIVNLNFIKEFRPYFNGEFILLMQDGARLKLSRSYKERFRQWLGEK